MTVDDSEDKDSSNEEKTDEETTLLDLNFDAGSWFLASLINASSVVAIRMMNIDYKYKSQVF